MSPGTGWFGRSDCRRARCCSTQSHRDILVHGIGSGWGIGFVGGGSGDGSGTGTGAGGGSGSGSGGCGMGVMKPVHEVQFTHFPYAETAGP
jgi:hypothetical protein